MIQAEGICIEMLGEKLFARECGKPKTKKIVDSMKLEKFEDAFVEPLRFTGGINATKEEKDIFQGVLNRHEILHGISIDYGTEVNSFKAMSLLEYIGIVVCDIVKTKQGKDN